MTETESHRATRGGKHREEGDRERKTEKGGIQADSPIRERDKVKHIEKWKES